MSRKKDGLVLGILFLTVLAVYFPALKHWFINDDLVHLKFVRDFEGSYLDFLFPHLRPSDVVTNARYEPFHIWFYAALYRVFGDYFPAYQLLHIALHALNAFLIFQIGQRLSIHRGWAFAAALLFCVYRLNSQEALWYSALFTTAAASLMLGAFLLFQGTSRAGQVSSVVLFLAASLLSVRSPQYLALAAAWLCIFGGEMWQRGMFSRKIKTFLAYAAVTGLSVIGSKISWHHFSNRLPGFEPDLFALPAFFLNLTFPYAESLYLKAAALLLVVLLVVIYRRDRVMQFLALALALNALFWFMIFSAGHLPYAPRYLYGAAGLFCLLLGHGLSLAVRNLSRPRRFAVTALAACLAGYNAFAVISQDVVWFRYLSVRGQKLEWVARLEGEEKKKVFVNGEFFPHDANLDYFRGRLEFVSEPGDGVFTVDLERNKYAEYFGRDIGRQYWFQPWFVKKPCREDVPWC